MTKLYKKDRSATRGRRVKPLINPELFHGDRNLITEDSGYYCPKCEDRVIMVSSPRRPMIRGLYCKCMQLVTHKDRVPRTATEWLERVERGYKYAERESESD